MNASSVPRSRILRVALLLIAVLALVSTVAFRKPAQPPSENTSPDQFYTTVRGSFPIVINVEGTLDAIKRYNLKYEGNNVNGGLRIHEIAEDRSSVASGQVVIQLDTAEVRRTEKELQEQLADLREKFGNDKEDLDRKFAEDQKKAAKDRRIETEIMLGKAEEKETLYFKTRADRLQEYADLKEDYATKVRDTEVEIATDMNKVKVAAEKLRTAADALEKYENLEARQTKNDLLTKIEQAEEQVNESRDTLTASRNKLADAQNKSPEERERLAAEVTQHQKKVDSTLIVWDLARAALTNHKQYGAPEKRRSLETEAVQARLALRQEVARVRNGRTKQVRALRDLKRKILHLKKDIDNLAQEREDGQRTRAIRYEEEMQTIAARERDFTAKYARDLERLKKTFTVQELRLEQQLTKLQENIGKMTITAPVDGIIALGPPNNNFYRHNQQKEWKVGTAINTNEIIASIPDLSRFKIQTNIPEVYRSMIADGMTAKLNSPAVPDLIMEGQILKIAPMTSNLVRWDPNSPKVYATEITTDSTDDRLMPGMTVNIELLVDDVENVLYLPIEALYTNGEGTYCKTLSAHSVREQPVKIGRRSNHYVEILEGINEGDRVALNDVTASN